MGLIPHPFADLLVRNSGFSTSTRFKSYLPLESRIFGRAALGGINFGRYISRNLGGGCFKYFWNFHPENWGKKPPIDEHIFSDGLAQPPTSLCYFFPLAPQFGWPIIDGDFNFLKNDYIIWSCGYSATCWYNVYTCIYIYMCTFIHI